MSRVIDLDDHRKRWGVLALCLTCTHRWVGYILARTQLFNLQCPACGDFDSFVNFIPDDYFEEMLKGVEEEGAVLK